MTASDEPSFRYSAFFSYRSTSRRIAVRLRRDLYAIAKRHRDRSELKIFLDTASLQPGSLGDEIMAALSRSRCLVVLLDREAVNSEWVSREIAHWLATVGAPDRLFLVRVDPSVDLRWDGEHQRFREPAGIPEPLRQLFEVEQKWVDFSGRAFFRPQDGLAGLCATLMDAETDEYLLEEAAYQRRRTRVVTAVAAVTVVLLVVATISAVVAVRNQRQAEENATQALAQADAAEALLTAADSPTVAIERALRASLRSDSPTVRSAMLAVSQAARRLTRAFVYPQSDTGHPVAAASFSPDGTRLLAWGQDRTSGTSRVQVWDVATGAVDASVTVKAADLRGVSRIGDGLLAGCSSAGPVLVTIPAATTSLLDGAWRDGRSCEAHEFGAGVVLLSTGAGAAGSAYAVDHRGAVLPIGGVDSVAAHPSSRSALLAGPAGVIVVTGGRPVPVSTAPGASATFADDRGDFLVRSGPQQWGVVMQGDGAPVLRTVTIPAAVAVAPVLDFGRMTGELAWITDDGTLGWTRDERRTRVENSQGESVWTPYDTSLEPLDDQDFVAVYRNTAVVVRPPTGSTVDAPLDALPATYPTEWTQTVVEQRLGVPGQGGTDPIVDRCAGHTAVLIGTDLPEGGSLLVDGSGEADSLDSRGRLTTGCDALDAGGSLSVLPSLGEPVELRTTLVADQVVASPRGDQVAIVQAGFPIQVLSTLPPGELPKPWDVTTGQGGAVTAFGERELFVEPRRDRGFDMRTDVLVIVDDGAGVVDRTPLPDLAWLAAARPDGTGAALVEFDSEQVLLAGGQQVRPADPACSAGTVRYVPGPGFEHSYSAAEAQIPVVRTGEATFLDCRDGREFSLEPTVDIVAYDLGRSTGRIVARSGDRVTVTTWSRGDESSLATIEGPPLPLDNSTASFDPTGQVGLTYPVGGRQLTLYRRDGGTWIEALGLATAIPGIVAAQVVDNGSLVLAVSAAGGFELFDATTGRLVASDPGLSVAYGANSVSGFSVRRVGDNLFVVLETTGEALEAEKATIKIPIGIPALKRQLCSLYPAKECSA